MDGQDEWNKPAVTFPASERSPPDTEWQWLVTVTQSCEQLDIVEQRPIDYQSDTQHVAPSSVVLLARLMGQYCFARLCLSVTLPAGGRAGRRASGRSGGWHCTAGQYGYVSLGRHLVDLLIVIVSRYAVDGCCFWYTSKREPSGRILQLCWRICWLH